MTMKAAHIAQLVENSTWKLQVVGLIPGLINLTGTNYLSDETLKRGHVWQYHIPSTSKNQAELSVDSSSYNYLL